MTKAEAMRKICAGAAVLLGADGETAWIRQDSNGEELGEADQKRMRAAFQRLCAELRRRGQPQA